VIPPMFGWGKGILNSRLCAYLYRDYTPLGVRAS